MGINIHDPLVQIKVTESVCGFVAICMTLARLWLRRDRYWWDDAWAFFSLLNLFVQFGAVFMHVEHPSDLSRLNRIAAYYLMAVTFYTVIWTARISILFSIIRIDPDPVMRHRLKWLAAAFVAAVAFLLSQLFWTCENIHGWKDRASPQCPLPKQIAICQLITDILADLSLILLPIRLIRGIKDRRLRWRLIFIFSTSIVTTIVSLVHAAYIISRGGIPVLISALVEDCMSLTVANLPVVATAWIRHVSGDSNGDGDGQRWSSFKFKTRTMPPSTGVNTTFFTTGFGAVSRGAAGAGVDAEAGTATELTGTSLERSKGTVSMGLGAYSIGSVGPDELFANGTKSVGGTAEKDDGRREDKGGVVRIDVLPYPREQPQPPKP
ncbi:hypothetical protein BJY52DRAFT_1130609 [Lactarius psammicola]|nr:hypothetical protein BJY52DRAFT_1130609 [Lactarius psammicola]